MSESESKSESRSKYVTVSYTCGSIEEARRMSRLFVSEQLVACAQIIPWIESIYTWNTKLHTTQESMVICKTHAKCLPRLKERILQETSYDVPEIIVQDIIDGHEEYLKWIDASVDAKNEAVASHAL